MWVFQNTGSFVRFEAEKEHPHPKTEVCYSSDMAASSSSASLFGIREGDQNPMNPQHSSATTPASSATAAAPPPPQKKKRNQPGTPNPDAEVIALSPKTLMATNRFICEVCNKGFQREQNLQLHRRGHNLPWKLKQKTTKEPKRKVYLCPEPTCVHHDPSRALGDLTGIKKHYSRKHGEKKWKCEKCSKKYAVQSDWKAHSKTCGTREYRCDCGTLFSRRDSFITHRAFCDALAQESARQPSNLISSTIGSQLYGSSNNNNVGLGLSHQVGPQISSLHHHDHPAEILRLGGAAAARAGQFDHLLPASFRQSHHNSDMGMSIPSPAAAFFINPESSNPQNYQHQRNSQNSSDLHHKANFQAQLMQFADGGANNNNNSPTSGAANNNSNNLFNIPPFLSGNNFSEQLNASVNAAANANEGGSNNFFSDMQAGISSTSNSAPSLFSGGNNNAVTVPPLPHMSATALLQKAAQMGAASSSNNSSTASLLRSFGSSSSSSGTKADHHHHHHHHLYGGTTTTAAAATATNNNHNNNNIFGRNDDHNNNNLHDLMNSFTAAVGGGGGFHEGSYDHSNPNRDLKLPVGCDRLTRDFLGVGQIVRSMSGGINSPRDHHQHHQHGFINLASLETQRNNNNNNNNAAASGQSFGGDGGNFQ